MTNIPTFPLSKTLPGENYCDGDSPLFWNMMMMRQVKTFRTSAMTTADVVKKRSPGNVRT